MHTLPKNFLTLYKENSMPKEIYELLLRQVTKMQFGDALNTIDVVLKCLGPKPTRVTCAVLAKVLTIDSLNSIKGVLNAYLDSRTTF